MKPVTFADVQTQRSTHIEPSDYVNVYIFSPGDIKVVSVPNGYSIAAFSATSNFFVNFNNAIASGAANTTGTGDELNPTTRYIDGISSFSIYSGAANTVVVSFYGVQ